MFTKPTDTAEVADSIRVLNMLKETSTGVDDVGAKVVRCSFESFREPLTHVLNLYLTQGTVLGELKVHRWQVVYYYVC